MHERGTIHGDIRPANIMRKVGVGVGSYEWIDLGMGTTGMAKLGRSGAAA